MFIGLSEVWSEFDVYWFEWGVEWVWCLLDWVRGWGVKWVWCLLVWVNSWVSLMFIGWCEVLIKSDVH